MPLRDTTQLGQPVPPAGALPGRYPQLPDDVTRRFPTLTGWQEENERLYRRLREVIADGQQDIAIPVAQLRADQSSTTTILASVVSEVTGLEAQIIAEAEAREEADGFLEGKYALTVIAGDVITGLTITSSSAADGGTVSQVTFQADKFQIYNGTTGLTMFDVDSSSVRLGAVLTVDTFNTKVFVGAGNYANADTPFYVSQTAFSLGSKLSFTAGALTVDGSGTFSGTITAGAGSIGGWDIGSTTISKHNAVLNSGGQLVLGTSNDVVYLSATDATYRMWIGNATSGSAAFRVTKAGVMTATGASLSGGTITSTGAVGTFTAGGGFIEFTATGYDNILSALNGLIMVMPSGDTAMRLRKNSDAQYRWAADIDGTLNWGSGSGALDTDLYRNAAGVLRTSGSLQVDGDLGVVGTAFASVFSGSGASLTALNASNISSGTLDNARLPSAISVTSLTASGSVAGGSLNINAVQLINSSRELRSTGLVLADNDANKCNLVFQDHGGSDVAFTRFMKIFANGGTVYVPYTTSAP